MMVSPKPLDCVPDFFKSFTDFLTVKGNAECHGSCTGRADGL
jgi:hypothetical protein